MCALQRGILSGYKKNNTINKTFFRFETPSNWRYVI